MTTTIVTIVEQVTDVTVQQSGVVDIVTIGSNSVDVVTVGEQGPPGAALGFEITVSDTPPAAPSVGDVWIDTSS